MPRLSRRSNLVVRAGGFIGSANNLVSCMCLASVCVYSPDQSMRKIKVGYSTQKACLRRVNAVSRQPEASRDQRLGIKCLSAEVESNSARHEYVQIVVASTTIFLAAGRFGLTPSANRLASPGLKLQGNDSGLKTGDPAGFTATDVLYLGTIGAGQLLRPAVAGNRHKSLVSN